MNYRLRIAVLPVLLIISMVVLEIYSILGLTASRAHAAGQFH